MKKRSHYLPLVPVLFLMTALFALDEPEGHPGFRLIVYNGSGDGFYDPAEVVPIQADIPNTFSFVKWFKNRANNGFIDDLYEDSTDFSMPNQGVQLVAVSAKIESWFPIFEENETLDMWFLYPKPEDGSLPQRFPHRVRITIHTAARIKDEDAFQNMQIRLGWFPESSAEGVWGSEELVEYWETETSTTPLQRNHFLNKELFEKKGNGVYEATIWYSGKWEPKVIPDGAEYVPPAAVTGFTLMAHGPDMDRFVSSTQNHLIIPALLDSDQDGLLDEFEMKWFGSLEFSAEDDNDQDGFKNAKEQENNTNPLLADTDQDGRVDSEELLFGTNPLWRDHPDVELEVYIVR